MKRKNISIFVQQKTIKCITAIVCHCNRVAKDSLALLKKKCMSLGSWRPCPKLRATWPPSPWAQLLKLVVIGRGSFLILKNVCNPTARREEEDATLDPTRTVGRAPPVGSWITMPPDAGVGVLREVSPDSLGGWLAVRCLFRVRVARGGWFLPCVCCCYVIGPVPSRIRSIVIVLLVTISPSLCSVFASKEFTDSTSAWSVGWASARGSSTGLWAGQPWKIEFVEVSITGTSDCTLVNRGPRSRASPIIRFGGRKFGCCTSMYDKRRSSTKRACLKVAR